MLNITVSTRAVNLALYFLLLAILVHWKCYFTVLCIWLNLLFWNSSFNKFDGFLPERIAIFRRRECRAFKGVVAVAIQTFLRAKRNQSISRVVETAVQRYGKKAIFRYDGKEWTLEEIDQYANQVAHYFSTVEKLEKGECVALLATACPQYVAIWLGLNKIGCITALINCNLKDEPLRHAITVAKCKATIVGVDLFSTYWRCESTSRYFQKPCRLRSLNYSWFDKEIEKMLKTKPVVDNPPGYFDTVCYIFTSGTTGLPKPCVITSHRMYAYIISHHYILDVRSDDVLYCTLPLYHSAGGVVAVGQGLIFGTTVVMRKQFSASKFWPDVVKNKCTAFQYIGELCRYLLAQPFHPAEKEHSLRLVYGVGLRPQIWREFAGRFSIPRIIECYGSTEGNTGFTNIDGRPGAVGFTSRIVEAVKKQFFIKVDAVTGEPIRDAEGLCIRCKANEPGELVGQITSGKFNSFDGYLQKDATQKKYIENVKKPGDVYFRSGDIMVYDDLGYVYFMDRIGDTYRWKGENVSTSEVEGVISRLLDDVNVAVFGVEIPGCEGRAGMACIGCSDARIDLRTLSEQVTKRLPAYARPLFLRFLCELSTTGTFKIQKAALKDDSYNVTRTADPVYFWSNKSANYEKLHSEQYEEILRGRIRF
ncbi:long-chain fatty acid transport protein 4-like [Paramacrobiotus metropolitanus]|uniref:long-chain fatty acid transport protein 4-like n=1 Tax=Paramacrobiotus metropolitanus TaxID=2943436 RepID=UPI002445828B|nr:long-chain fatty acid transport protein 4-like [Paramacrobiotus metropolitanus]